mgnify:CR=1 FL=1|tara:strand:+ start:543 stop:1283 length:741 start_codon:yes stop_codon:yes gene_type:complete
MTSAINPSNLDGTYPIAGQDNDSQGFRDNFTNTANNFTAAKTEIEDLQAKAVLKSALSGGSLDNDMAASILKSPQLVDASETRVAKGASSGTVTFSHDEGQYQTLSTSGAVSFGFNNWPAAGQKGRLQVEIAVANVTHTITLPAEVTVGESDIMGYEPTGRTITFLKVGTYILEFWSDDAGTTVAVSDLSRSRTIVDFRTIATSIGVAGDLQGMVAIDANFIYACTADYDAASDVWLRTAHGAGTW